MSLFDFFKKKELAKISELNQELEQYSLYQTELTKHIDDLTQYQASLSKQVEELSQYQGIVDIDHVIAAKTLECEALQQAHKEEMLQLDAQLSEVKQNYSSAITIYQELMAKISIFRDDLELTEYGVYEPHFDFECSEQYKDAIRRVRELQKALITQGKAIVGGDNISWNGSMTQGQAMVKREKKLMMRAFNGECDSFIASVNWNNVQRMQTRMEKSFTAINKTYATQGITITEQYKMLKIQELQLSYEYMLRKHEEKVEQRAIREQIREEERAAREFETARKQAEREELNYQQALDKAREQIEQSHGEKESEMQSQIAELEAKLREVEEKKQRALSMAQQTKNGHVYVISNIGSFGENVYKIGMTRRLDPLDRVVELGDASVPFRFDVHAMIFAEDAPALENKLHQAFAKKRVNLVNPRKEFFQVTLEEIAAVVEENFGTIEFTKLAEAAEFRSSYAIKLKEYEDYQLQGRTPQAAEAFPLAI